MKKYEFSVKLQHSIFFLQNNFNEKMCQIAMFCFDFRIDDFTRIFISKYVIILGT